MENTELRIGNLVNVTIDNETEITKILSLKADSSEVELFTYLLDTIEDFDLENSVTPIPLTDDIAEMLGFECLLELAVHCDCYIQDNLLWYDTKFDSIEIKSVNQLQNLHFSLTGEELTIKEND